VALGLGVCLAWGSGASETEAGEPSSTRDVKKLYYKSRSFRIPLAIDPEDRARIKEVYLSVSSDQGETWRQAGQPAADRSFISYKAPRDGEYWIAVQTLDTKGRLYPPNEAVIEPSMKVVVDTTPPVVTLAPLSRRGGRVSVRWEISDAHLDPKSLTLEYREDGAPNWRQVPVRKPSLIGSEEWDAGTPGPIAVRATVADRAGNEGKTELPLGEGIATQPASASGDPRELEAPPPVAPITSVSNSQRNRAPRVEDAAFTEDTSTGDGGDAVDSGPVTAGPAGNTLRVKSQRFPLQYSVEGAGPSGPAVVELWTTRDGGQTWTRQPEDSDHASPYNVDLGADGTYGLWLVVQSAAGLGDPPPSPGDRPQMWVEVDSQPPSVQLDRPRVGIGNSFGKVKLTWRASDAHLASRPIALFFRADRPDAPWQPIAARLENTGQFIWTVPGGVPPRFHVRIEVTDAVGNRTAADTTEQGAVLLDRSRPKGHILGLDPSAFGAGEGRARQ
jgi:hypothetical protein